MKVLHIVPSYLPAYRYGGPIESVHALNKWLVRAGVQVTVYTTNVDGPENLDVPTDRPVNVDGVEVHYFPVGFPRGWVYSGKLRRALRDHAKDFDIVHITSVFLSASILGAYYAKRAHKPYIISPRGSLMKTPLTMKSAFKKKIYIALIEKWALKNAAAIHFTAPMEEKEYKETGLPLRRTILIPNSLDPARLPEGDAEKFRKKFHIPKERKVILFLSRINWKKGLDVLIEAYASLRRELPDALLVIAGGDDENYRGTIEDLAKKEGVLKEIVFTGELSGPEKTAAFRAADVFALSSYSENFGMSVIEAMHLGLPVVVTKEVGVAPWVDQGEAGFVVNPKPQEVRMALFQALKNPESLKQMGENGRRVVEREFSPQAVADKFMRAYNELIHEQGAGHRHRPYV